MGTVFMLAYWKNGAFSDVRAGRNWVTRTPGSLHPQSSDPLERELCVVVRNKTAQGYTLAWVPLDGLHAFDNWIESNKATYCGANFGPGLILD